MSPLNSELTLRLQFACATCWNKYLVNMVVGEFFKEQKHTDELQRHQIWLMQPDPLGTQAWFLLN